LEAEEAGALYKSMALMSSQQEVVEVVEHQPPIPMRVPLKIAGEEGAEVPVVAALFTPMEEHK